MGYYFCEFLRNLRFLLSFFNPEMMLALASSYLPYHQYLLHPLFQGFHPA